MIGLGRIGCEFDLNPNVKFVSSHVGAYLNNPKTKLSTICDLNEKKALKYSKIFNIEKYFTDYSLMLKNENLDIISICTWPESHAKIVETAVNNNVKGIFLEKPISNSLTDAKKIIKLCKKYNVKLQIDFQRRFDPIFRNLKNLINQKKLTDIQTVNIFYGGGINNTGSHICDLIRYFFGEIETVSGKFSKNKSHLKTDPNIDGILFCKNGINCNLHSVDYKNFGLVELDIIGKNYRIITDLRDGTSKFYEKTLPRNGLLYNELIQKELIQPKQSSSILNGLNNLLESIKNDSIPFSTDYDGYSSLEIVLGLIKSAKNNGKNVTLHRKKQYV